MRSIEDIRREHRLYNEDHRYCTFCEQEWPCDASVMAKAYDRLAEAAGGCTSHADCRDSTLSAIEDALAQP